MDDIISYAKKIAITEAKSESFDDGAREWFLDVSDNSEQWKYSKILTISKEFPNEKNFDILNDRLKKSPMRPGRDGLLQFLAKIKMGTYKSEFKKKEGKNSAIDELFKLIQQAIEY